MAHDTDRHESAHSYNERRRRQRTPQDRFVITNGEDPVETWSSYALAHQRMEQLEEQRPDFRGRLRIRDTRGKS